MPTSSHTTVDGDHGRIETRAYVVSTDIAWLQELHQWSGLTAIGKVTRTREAATKVTTETAYYLLSAPLSAERFGHAARSHWAVENNLHWVLDVIMNEDNARNRCDTARITSPSCAIWPLISFPRNPPKAPCVSKSNGPAGTTPTSQSSSPKSEMRLPGGVASAALSLRYHADSCHRVVHRQAAVLRGFGK